MRCTRLLENDGWAFLVERIGHRRDSLRKAVIAGKGTLTQRELDVMLTEADTIDQIIDLPTAVVNRYHAAIKRDAQ